MAARLLICLILLVLPGVAPAAIDPLLAAIAAGEYRASAGPTGLQAPNRAHGIRIHFDRLGVRVHERREAGRPLFGLRLRGLGRGPVLAPVSPGTVVDTGARVEIRRPGIVEWYRNSAAGLEQGFDLAARPPDVGPLVLDLDVHPARARIEDGRIVLSTPTGRSLEYGGLVVTDARGQALRAHFAVEAAGRRLQVVVLDQEAHYPIVIDPTIVAREDAELSSDDAGSRLGFRVAGAGDVDGDGYADVIVGAYLYDGGAGDAGAAFLFHGGPSGIGDGDPTTAATRLASDQVGADFGIAVCGAGDVNDDGYDDVIVGARNYDNPTIDEGAAFVFLGGPDGVGDADPSTAATTLESDQASASFGASVAAAGDVDGDGYDDVIVGAFLYDAGESDEGAAFVFHGSAAGVPSGNPATADATLEGNQVLALMGLSTAGAGDVNGDGYADVVVGAPLYDASLPDEGAAFVFHGSAGGVISAGPLTAATRLRSGQSGADFGFSVAGAGDVNRDGKSDVIVGADEWTGSESAEGGAFVFLGSPSGVTDATAATAATRLESGDPGADFGIAVGGAGDVDGDGYDDVVVGAHLYDEGAVVDLGGAWVFTGGFTGVLATSPDEAFAALPSPGAGVEFGRSVAGAGDVDGDGFADLIVGAPLTGGAGSAFVFRGEPPKRLPALSLLGAFALASLLGATGAASRRSR